MEEKLYNPTPNYLEEEMKKEKDKSNLVNLNNWTMCKTPEDANYILEELIRNENKFLKDEEAPTIYKLMIYDGSKDLMDLFRLKIQRCKQPNYLMFILDLGEEEPFIVEKVKMYDNWKETKGLFFTNQLMTKTAKGLKGIKEQLLKSECSSVEKIGGFLFFYEHIIKWC